MEKGGAGFIRGLIEDGSLGIERGVEVGKCRLFDN
jgi:hypothetical protein